jgi:hypothetical protein
MGAHYFRNAFGHHLKVLSHTKRNVRRRARYVPTGRKPGRPRRYSNVVRTRHHARHFGPAKASVKHWLY